MTWELGNKINVYHNWAWLSWFCISMNTECPAPGQKEWATQLDPQHYGCFLSPVPRAGFVLSKLQLPDTQLRSYTIWVWSYETFCKTVIDRYLAVVFGSARTQWGHLANLQLSWHSYCQEPAAIRTVPLHPSSFNAGIMKQYECGCTQPLLWSKPVVNRKLVVET
jgi:hypothetical protein